MLMRIIIKKDKGIGMQGFCGWALSLLLCLGLGVGGVQQAQAQQTIQPRCIKNGGTEIPGCIDPKIYYTAASHMSNSTPVYDSFASAFAQLVKQTQENSYCNGECVGLLNQDISWYGTDFFSFSNNCQHRKIEADKGAWGTYYHYGAIFYTGSLYAKRKKLAECKNPGQPAQEEVYFQAAPMGSAVGVWPQCPSYYTLIKEEYGKYTGNFGFSCVPYAYSINFTSWRENAFTDGTRLTCQDGPKQGCASAGNPVDLSTGLKTDYQTDLVVPGDYPLVWSRGYAEFRKEITVSNMNWSFSHLKRVDITIDPYERYVLFAHRGDDSLLVYNGFGEPGSREWRVKVRDDINKVSITSTVKDWGTQGVIITNHFGISEYYNNEGRLIKTVDLKGNEHHYFYNNQGLLVKIQQDNGRYIEIRYRNIQFNHESTASWIDNGATEDDDATFTHQEIRSISNLNNNNEMFLFPPISSVTDGVRTIEYEWKNNYSDNYNFLIGVTDSGGKKKTLHYGEQPASQYAWTGWTDADNYRMGTYYYSSYSSQRVESQWKGSGYNETNPSKKINYLEYSFYERKITDGLSNEFTHGASQGLNSYYNKPCRWCYGDSYKSVEFDSKYRYKSMTMFNNQKNTFIYDNDNNISSFTEAETSPIDRTTTYTWTEKHHLPLTKTEQVTVNGQAGTRVTVWTYNAHYQPTSMSITAMDGGISKTRVWLMEYDSNKRLSLLIQPSGVQTKYWYNTYGDLIAREENHGTTAAQLTRWGGYQSDGLPRWSIDAHNIISLYTWDGNGKLLATQQWESNSAPSTVTLGNSTWMPGNPSGANRLIGYEYSDAGRLTRTDHVDGTYTLYAYDFAGRLVQLREYGLNGQLIAQTDLTLNVMSDVTSTQITDGQGNLVRKGGQVLDEQGRMKQALNAAQTALFTQNYNTEHLPTNSNDALNRNENNEYDALNRLVKFVDAEQGISEFTYGKQDEVLTAKDPKGVVTQYEYNGFGDMVLLTSPDRGAWQFTYDGAGRNKTIIDPRGVLMTTVYDNASRPQSRSYSTAAVSPAAGSGWTPGNVTHTFSYDTCTKGLGRLCEITDKSGTTAFVYNAWGNILGKAWTGTQQLGVNGVQMNWGYGYDVASDRQVSQLYPSGKLLLMAYGPDGDGNVNQMTYDGTPVATQIRFNPVGQVKGWTWAQSTGWSGVHSSVQYDYDADGRPVQIKDIDQRDLAWDIGDRLTGVIDTNDIDASQVYDYDLLDRLKKADVGKWNSALNFSYDAVGNRLSKKDDTNEAGWTFSYGATHNRLTGQTFLLNGSNGGEQPVTYDAMGNMVNDGQGLSMSYDATGRMVSGSKDGQSLEAIYNALGQRMVKRSNGAETFVYLYDEAGRPLGSYVVDANAADGYRVQEEFIHLDGFRPIASVRPHATTGMNAPQIYPILSDHLGTPRKVLDGSTGHVRWSWDAKEPFGDEAPNETPTAGLNTFGLDLRFPGQRSDEETGLFQNGFRDYHPGLGRYVESDPIGLDGGWNTYSYVSSQVNQLIDPSGLLQRDPSGKIVFNPKFKKTMVYHSERKEKSFMQAGLIYTDKGREVIAFVNIPDHPQSSANMNYNCHGYSFGDSEVFIDNRFVDIILEDDNYTNMGKFAVPQDGDIVVYRDKKGAVVHSARLHKNGLTTHKPGVSTSHIISGTIQNSWDSTNYSIYRKR